MNDMKMLAWLLLAAAAGIDPMGVPRVEDPTPIIDADLGDWDQRGAAAVMNTAAHVTYRPSLWRGAEDLSAEIRVGYDSKFLYVAANVTDDVVAQTLSGQDLWRGDHVLVMLDFVRTGAEKNLIQLGLSPGDVDAPQRTRPEIFAWLPKGLAIRGGAIASRRTAKGYALEAAVPFADLGVKPAKFMTFGIELAVMDNDAKPPQQKTVLSRNPRKWARPGVDRLLAAGLATRTGELPADIFEDKAVELVDALTIEPKGQREYVIDIDKLRPGRIAALTFKARTVFDRSGGCIGGLGIEVNGKPISKKNLPNRPVHMQLASGISTPSMQGHLIALFYATDFSAVDKTAYAPLGFKACDYTLRIDDLVKPGKNTITIKNSCHISWRAKPLSIALADVKFSWATSARFKPPKVYKDAPTGALAVYEPDTNHKADYSLSRQGNDAITVTWGGQQRTVNTNVKLPDDVAQQITRKRTIEKLDELILVTDTFTNNTGKIVPAIIEHKTTAGRYKRLYLCGRPVPTNTGSNTMPENPSVVVVGESGGGEASLGLMAYDDIFRLHCSAACDGKTLQIADRNLALRPGVTYKHQWVIAPLARPDYWQFVNRMRRHYDVNFAIDGSFAFFMFDRKHTNLIPWDAVEWLDHKAARYVCVFVNSNYKGHYAQGLTKRFVNPRTAIMTNKVLRAIRPGTHILTYFNCFDYTQPPDEKTQWPGAVVRRPDGKPIRGDDVMQVYMPIKGNGYAEDLQKTVDWTFDVLKTDAYWWDMYNGYGTHYGEPWDGWTVDIDPQNMTITKRKSSTALLTWPWREKLTKRMLDEGRPLVVSGSPMMHSEVKYKLPRVVETADIGRLSRSHLFTPIALGDHITEKSVADAYRHMLSALDFGGLYYWYSITVTPTHPTLTSHMFPFTPIELHSGYLIGQERILTNRSGLFGWGDASQFDVHVYNRVGAQTDKVKVKRIERDGKAYAEVRIPEGYSAAIVRR